jgi:hypothetical protein
VVPSPGAMRVTGVSVAQLVSAELPTHYVMIRAIREKLLSWSPSLFIGFNSMSFDERLLRQALYQTLHPPYLTNTSGNCRADALRMVRAALFTPGARKTSFDGVEQLALVLLERQNELGTPREHLRGEGPTAMQRIGGNDAAFERQHLQYFQGSSRFVAARRLARGQHHTCFHGKYIDHMQRRAALAAPRTALPSTATTPVSLIPLALAKAAMNRRKICSKASAELPSLAEWCFCKSAIEEVQFQTTCDRADQGYRMVMTTPRTVHLYNVHLQSEEQLTGDVKKIRKKSDRCACG